MTISQELEEKILRYFYVEKWCVGTIATQLGLHQGRVDPVLSHAGRPRKAALDGSHRSVAVLRIAKWDVPVPLSLGDRFAVPRFAPLRRLGFGTDAPAPRPLRRMA